MLRRLLKGMREAPPDAALEVLKTLEGWEARVRDMSPVGKGPRVVMGPTFTLFEPSMVHDRLLEMALRLRGAHVTPVYCDAVQNTECNVAGGVWAKGDFASACMTCRSRSEMLWGTSPVPPVRLSDHLGAADHVWADQVMSGVQPGAWSTVVEDGLPFGSWARHILVNNAAVGAVENAPDHERLGRNHVRNLLLLHRAYPRVLRHVRADRVVSNDSFYGMWALLQTHARRAGIPFYSQWIGGRRGGWCYARDDAAMNLDFSAAWPQFSSIPLDERQKALVDQWLAGRWVGKDMILDTASAALPVGLASLPTLDPQRPTALMACNVVWDLAALDKQVVFPGMMEWVVETIRWFAAHPEYQLVIKPHPAELNPTIPHTRERVATVLEARGISLPSNVVLLRADGPHSVYALLKDARVLLVHSTTVGLEAAALGHAVLTTARSPYRGFGFTMDPVSAEEYWSDLGRLLGSPQATDASAAARARQLLFFYQFHYYSRTGLLDYEWNKPVNLLVKGPEDLLPGRNPALDHMVDSILGALPIVDAHRWPPET